MTALSKPRAKDHVRGTYQVAFFVRLEDGSTIEFASKKPLTRDHKLVCAVADAVAAACGVKIMPGALTKE